MADDSVCPFENISKQIKWFIVFFSNSSLQMVQNLPEECNFALQTIKGKKPGPVI